MLELLNNLLQSGFCCCSQKQMVLLVESKLNWNWNWNLVPGVAHVAAQRRLKCTDVVGFTTCLKQIGACVYGMVSKGRTTAITETTRAAYDDDATRTARLFSSSSCCARALKEEACSSSSRSNLNRTRRSISLSF